MLTCIFDYTHDKLHNNYLICTIQMGILSLSSRQTTLLNLDTTDACEGY